MAFVSRHVGMPYRPLSLPGQGRRWELLPGSEGSDMLGSSCLNNNEVRII